MTTTAASNPQAFPTTPGFWSQATVEKRVGDIIKCFRTPAKVKQGAIELRMGAEAFVTGKKERTLLPEKTGEVVIPPGQFALLLTEERVCIPRDAIGFISIKFGLKARGLVNVSGFHVDPGFDGWLTFSVYNAGPSTVTIARGTEAFLLWLAAWDQPTAEDDQYSSRNNTGRGQLEKLDDNLIMNLQGEIASPGSLNTKIEELRKEFNNVQSNQKIIIALGLALLGGVAVWGITAAFKPPSPPVVIAPIAPAAIPAASTVSSGAATQTPTQAAGPALSTATQPELAAASLEHDLLAAVMSSGKAVFAVESHRDRAVIKAREIAAKALGDQAQLPPSFQPIVVTFRTSEELFAAIRPEAGMRAEVAILARRQKCGRLVPGSDTGCRGDENGGYRTVLYEHHVCEPGSATDECWNNLNATVGRWMTYSSQKACENGATPTTNDRIVGSSCD